MKLDLDTLLALAQTRKTIPRLAGRTLEPRKLVRPSHDDPQWERMIVDSQYLAFSEWGHDATSVIRRLAKTAGIKRHPEFSYTDQQDNPLPLTHAEATVVRGLIRHEAVKVLVRVSPGRIYLSAYNGNTHLGTSDMLTSWNNALRFVKQYTSQDRR